MNRLAALLILAIAFAAPVGAQEQGKIRVVIPAESAAKLKGTVGEPAPSGNGESTPAGDLSALIPAPVPVLPTALRPDAGAQQCRRTCHQAYYFCLSAEDEAVCSPTWVKCTARCGT